MDGITSTLRYIISKATTKLARYYTRKDRNYRYKNFRLVVFKSVFHPGLYRSTAVMAGWLEQQSLQGWYILEIGSGSGLLSMIAASKGAHVTAVDLNPAAVENTRLNTLKNNLDIKVMQSDMFDAVPHTTSFDMILVNPPYYPRDPVTEAEKAWFCGSGFSYFQKLFHQLHERTFANKCYMVLSDTCDLDAIQRIALENGIKLEIVFREKISGESLLIYHAVSISH